MSLSLFGWNIGGSSSLEIPSIFPLSIAEADFVNNDTLNIYLKILTDTVERTEGVPEDKKNLLWDNCVQSESNDGLITLLSKAMTDKNELFLVYKAELKLIRKATSEEAAQIKADYQKSGQSSVGTYISFKNYTRTDMVKLYSALEYCTVAALSKSMNLSKAIQIKISDLRGSVGLTDKAVAEAQALAMATGLSQGKDIVTDAKDIVETSKPDLTATQSSMEFIAEKRSFYLGMPASYITGEAPKGLGDSGEGDAKAVERGLKNYYFSIIKPVLESIFGIKTTFKSEDFRQISSALEAMKTFELTSGELLSQENKRIIINKMLGLDPETEGDPPEEVEDPNADPLQVVPGQKPVKKVVNE